MAAPDDKKVRRDYDNPSPGPTPAAPAAPQPQESDRLDQPPGGHPPDGSAPIQTVVGTTFRVGR